MAAYPVTFDIGAPPEKFQRPQLILRLLLYFLVGWVLGLVYWLPVLSAIFISQKGSAKFLEEDGPRVTGWLRWLMALYAYLGLTTDRTPFAEDPGQIIRFEVKPQGTPTVGSALLRLIFSIPSYFVLSLIGIVAFVLWLVAAVYILIQETYPKGILDFFRGYLRWEARLLGYHASLVDQYPPFALETGPEAA